MCGIFLYLRKLSYQRELTDGQLYDAFMKIKHRGPDRSNFLDLTDYGLCIGFHRLSIMDLTLKGDQPFKMEDDEKQIFAICNGELYNFEELAHKYAITLSSGSDCEILIHLYQQLGMEKLCQELVGEFAFCIIECFKITKEVKVHISRDQLGVRQLYITGDENECVITSELKGSPFLFADKEYYVDQFEPRSVLTLSTLDDKLLDCDNLRYRKWLQFEDIQSVIFDITEAKSKIREAFERAVKLMIHGDRELCCLLSGGVDSSLVCALIAKLYKQTGKRLKTYSIGLPGSTDEPYAELCAKYIDSDHEHIMFSEQDFLDALEEVIEILETYDITTIRATVGQYLLSKWISEHTKYKILFGGDVSDELFGGYKYFKNAPSAEALHFENIRLLNDIHKYDGKRCDAAVSRNGIELRLLFDYVDLLKLVLSIDPILRMPIGGVEKWLLRESFKDTGLLPDEILFRSKEAFSDGVSKQIKSWYQVIQEKVEQMFTDEEYNQLKNTFVHLPPVSKESLYYRLQFIKYYGSHVSTSKVLKYYWLPLWCGSVLEPSARILEVYK